MPLGTVWDYYCLRAGVPLEQDWMVDIRRYESGVLSGRQ